MITAPRLLIVAGAVPGRASIAAAAAEVCARHGPTFLVDANDPAHRLGDVMGTGLLDTVPRPWDIGAPRPHPLLTCRLSVDETAKLLEEMQAMDKWREMLHNDAGGRLAAALGVPKAEFLSLLNCFRPPPGAEIPVALARVLRNHPDANNAAHIIVDAGPVSDAAKLQTIPRAIADTLDGVVRLHDIVQTVKKNASPFAMAGLSLMLGGNIHEKFIAQLQTTMSHLEEIQVGMKSLAALEQGTLLVLPHAPGPALISGNQRLYDRLQPSCVALTCSLEEAKTATLERPVWLPKSTEAITLPFGKEIPVGVEAVKLLAKAMVNQS